MAVTPDTGAATPMGGTLVAHGATFRVWAPRAREVYLVGRFSGEDFWQPRADHLLTRTGDYWAGYRAGAGAGDLYKFWVVGEGSAGYKRDPYARELSSDPAYPFSNCVLRGADSYAWRAAGWRTPDFADLILYQLHVGTFAGPDRPARVGTFLDVIDRLDYLADLGVSGLQLLPVVEFSSPRSLGYDGSDLFSPEMDYTLEGDAVAPYLPRINARLAAHGQPPVSQAVLATPINQLKLLVDLCHLAGIAVLLDVVYNHAGHQIKGQTESLWFFDRMAGGDANLSLYFTDREHTGPVFAFWNQAVRGFLIDNASFFLDEYRIDGLRYDQVSVIDYENRGPGWQFCQECTDTLRSRHPAALQIAEYWPRNPAVTAPRYAGGAGFDSSWNDGFREALRGVVAQTAGGTASHLNLAGLARELTNPGYRDGWRAVNYVESHDEVYRDREPRLARLADPSNPRSWYARSRSRVATALLLTAPGIPMLFMGQEILEDKPWADDPANHPDTLIWWDGLSQGDKAMVDQHRLTRELIWLRRQLPALRNGATRVYHLDPAHRVLAMHRWLEGQGEDVVVVASFAEATHGAYRLGLPQPGHWREAINTDVYDNWANPLASGNGGSRQAQPHALHGFSWSADLVLPANAVLVLVLT